MHRVLGRSFPREFRMVSRLLLLWHIASGNPVIFQPEVAACAVRVKMRLKILDRQVPPDVTIEFTIDRAARIADLCAPNLLAGLDIASKCRHAVWTHHRRMDAVTRPRVTVKYRVRVGNKVFDAGLFEQIFDALLVCALGQPDASRLPAKVFLIISDGDLYLRASRLVRR